MPMRLAAAMLTRRDAFMRISPLQPSFLENPGGQFEISLYLIPQVYTSTYVQGRPALYIHIASLDVVILGVLWGLFSLKRQISASLSFCLPQHCLPTGRACTEVWFGTTWLTSRSLTWNLR